MAENVLKLRTATLADVPELTELISASTRVLQAPYYNDEQIEASLGSVFGVDHTLINDRTYFVAEADGKLVGCGGWSRRKTLYGSDHAPYRSDEWLDPKADAAKIRAFFVHPEWARRGIGSMILRHCEEAAFRCGFRTAELASTLAGEALYRARGYEEQNRFEVPLPTGKPLTVIRMMKALKSKDYEGP